jgi:hypothetical protein
MRGRIDRREPEAAKFRKDVEKGGHTVIPKTQWSDMAFMAANRAKFNSGEYVREDAPAQADDGS